jgi:uncharacterized protein
VIAQHRQIRDGDGVTFLPWRPYHTHDEVQPLAPGDVHQLDEVFGGKVTIHAGGAHPSHLLLPIVPGT